MYGNLLVNLCLLIFVLGVLQFLSDISMIHALDMDVKCAVYQTSEDENGEIVDVRTLVMGLKGNFYYTAQVLPDHNPPEIVTGKSDSEGIFWIVVKVPNGEHSLLFKVNVYEGNGTDGRLVGRGDDDVPCYRIPNIGNSDN